MLGVLTKGLGLGVIRVKGLRALDLGYRVHAIYVKAFAVLP